MEKVAKLKEQEKAHRRRIGELEEQLEDLHNEYDELQNKSNQMFQKVC